MLKGKMTARWLLDALERAGRIRSSYPDPVQVWQFGDGPTLIAPRQASW